MSIWSTYRLRLERKRRLYRAFRKRRDLCMLNDQTGKIGRGDILAFVTLRNERIRLPYFLRYYRDMGVHHFLIVDNASDDGSTAYLKAQPDVSLWRTEASYKRARFGVDWMNWLLRKYGTGHWTLTVDPDEFFVYPFCDTRPITALTDWLDTYDIRSFPAMLLDMYPKGPIDAVPYKEGQDPFEIACWFDSGNYTISKNPQLHNLWIQGGPRARMFFAHKPQAAPSLNKIPLVKWERSFAFTSSTHMLLPRGLNTVYDEWGGEKASGCLLHAKFLSPMADKVTEELERREHFAGSREYKAYARMLSEEPELWCKWSEKYINWRQLEILGLISKGNWA
ncbi:glycosyltransferase family 2 protein [Paenirhodobacter sp. CAU 1674]|uniref:glycosyltransferase family 2 protein n=1 Tax=Paenirhodobacter sp. CAU 1674 TaxID=3032596 RepID=UPI0023DAB477|nr:glycosyltransferase family 2 protein [Paenirhodobacter sp. CAU 1674]MDF2140333.1 glycosyltransferase family 2 protein [Paenirhodobacter sp. CAU 1674]